MRRSLDQINSNYQKSKVDQWGSDWRGSLAFWHTFCIDIITKEIGKKSNLLNKPLSILEIGCGSGVLTEKVVSALKRVCKIDHYLAVDVSLAAINKAKEIFPNTTVDYQAVSEDLHDLNGQKFDLIFGFQFLFYLSREERQNLFERIYNLKSEDGMVILSSNIRFDSEDPDYINAPSTDIDLKKYFTILKEADIFTAPYVEYWEGKMLKIKKLPFISYILSKEYFPKKAHQYYSKRAMPTIPNKRTRVYILQ